MRPGLPEGALFWLAARLKTRWSQSSQNAGCDIRCCSSLGGRLHTGSGWWYTWGTRRGQQMQPFSSIHSFNLFFLHVCLSSGDVPVDWPVVVPAVLHRAKLLRRTQPKRRFMCREQYSTCLGGEATRQGRAAVFRVYRVFFCDFVRRCLVNNVCLRRKNIRWRASADHAVPHRTYMGVSLLSVLWSGALGVFLCYHTYICRPQQW